MKLSVYCEDSRREETSDYEKKDPSAIGFENFPIVGDGLADIGGVGVLS